MENYRLIAQQIADIRLLSNRGYFNIKEDKPVLNAYEDLAVFVTQNYEIPQSHRNYIYDRLEIEQNHVSCLADEIRARNKTIKDGFNVEYPLRAIEAFFSWGKPQDMELEDLISLKYLIAKLHGLVGDKTRKPLISN